MKREHGGLESRFQRSLVLGFDSWGVAPGYDEDALSALKTTAIGNLFSAKGAALTHSLGQRPRVVDISRSPALKARFTAVEALPTGLRL